ncbi:polysaccharide deacetylase family protein [Kitasatospora sp. NPDC050463]|uniref:polysaccharide deacetylase family protein n=1 Tax=Kitasatospora sp. NPDC050463 TaxID=3155786 RepID=UPI0033F5CC60
MSTVALTFDDGPHPDSTPALLDALTRAGVRATFFVCGEQVVRHPELLRALHEAGMWLGNHSHTHPHLPGLDDHALQRELEVPQQLLHRMTGSYPTLFRPPYCDTDARVRGAAEALGLTEVLCTTDTRDWAGADAESIVRAARDEPPGGVVLMHDHGRQTTVEAVPHLLAAWAERGLRPGPVPPQ